VQVLSFPLVSCRYRGMRPRYKATGRMLRAAPGELAEESPLASPRCSVAKAERSSVDDCFDAQALREHAADVGQFAAIRQLLSSYWSALLAAQRPLALQPAAAGGAGPPSVIRGGPSLGQLRPAVAAEAQPLGFAAPGHIAPTQVKRCHVLYRCQVLHCLIGLEDCLRLHCKHHQAMLLPWVERAQPHWIIPCCGCW
jgi:hypothetical protein